MFISSCCGILIPEFCSLRFQTLRNYFNKRLHFSDFFSILDGMHLIVSVLIRLRLTMLWACYELGWSPSSSLWCWGLHARQLCSTTHSLSHDQPHVLCCAAGQLVQRSQSINEINKQSPAPAPHCTLTSTSLWILLPGLDPFIAFSNGSILLSDQGLTLQMLFIRSTSWLGLSKFYQPP